MAVKALINAAIDSARKARMQRAEEQGYQGGLYHASDQLLTEFKPTRGGTYFSGDSDYVSNIFSRGATAEYNGTTEAGEYFARGNTFDARWKNMSDEGKQELRNIINSTVDKSDIEDAAQRLGVSIEDADPFEVFTDGEFYHAYGRNAQNNIMEAIKSKGYDKVIFPDSLTLGDGHVSTVVFDPKNIRSVNAQFDPAKSNSSNLLASAAGAGVLGAAALAPQEAEAGPLAAGARRFLDDRFLNALGGSNPRVGLRDTVAGMETGVAERVMDKGRPLNLGDYEGHPYILTQSDRSAAGGEIVSVHSTDIDPVDLRGGRDFMFDAPSEGQVWASDPNVIKSLYNRAEALSRSHGKDTILLPYSMAPTGIDFATMPLDTMVGFARAKMSKANIKKLDKSIKAIIPEWGGVADPNSIGIFRDVKGPKRKQVADLIDKDFRGVPGGMSISEARAATTDAAQYMSPEGQIMNIGRINTRSPIITESGHPTYVGGLPGRGEGTLENTLDVRPFMANNGRQLTGDAADIRALSMNHGLSQGVLDDTLLNRLYGERGNATPAALAVTAGATGTGMALSGSPEDVAPDRSMMDQIISSPYAEALGDAAAVAGRGANFVFDSLELPMRGNYGLAAALGVLAQGGTLDNALLKGSKVSGQSLDETGKQLGKYVADKTGNPYAAALTDALVNVATP